MPFRKISLKRRIQTLQIELKTKESKPVDLMQLATQNKLKSRRYRETSNARNDDIMMNLSTNKSFEHVKLKKLIKPKSRPQTCKNPKVNF